eukprot:2029493-Pleurochrysis_carterae.AAC.2
MAAQMARARACLRDLVGEHVAVVVVRRHAEAAVGPPDDLPPHRASNHNGVNYVSTWQATSRHCGPSRSAHEWTSQTRLKIALAKVHMAGNDRKTR